MADDKNSTGHQEEEFERAFYGQQLKLFEELIKNNQQKPDDVEWRLQRMITIRTLKELRKKLDTVCVGANYGKGTGSGAQLTGAVVSIVGAVMALGKSPPAKTVMNVGNLLNHSGTLVEGLSNTVESYVSAGYLREVKTVLDKDKELSQQLQEWLTFSRNLDTNVQIIFGSDLNSVIQNNILKVYAEFATLYNSTKNFHATVDLMRKGQYSMHIGTDVKIERLSKFSKELDAFPQYKDEIIKFFSHLSGSNKLLQVAKDGVKVYKTMYGENPSPAGNPGSDPVSAIPSGASEEHTILNNDMAEVASSTVPPVLAFPSVKEVSAFCGFQAIDIATSLVSLISATKVIRDGKSKFSDALKLISDLLEFELKSIEQLNR